MISLLGKVTTRKQVVAEQPAEIRTEGPTVDPALRDREGKAKRPGSAGQRRGRGIKRVGAAIEDPVLVAEVPPGSRFKGYESYLI